MRLARVSILLFFFSPHFRLTWLAAPHAAGSCRLDDVNAKAGNERERKHAGERRAGSGWIRGDRWRHAGTGETGGARARAFPFVLSPFAPSAACQGQGSFFQPNHPKNTFFVNRFLFLSHWGSVGATTATKRIFFKSFFSFFFFYRQLNPTLTSRNTCKYYYYHCYKHRGNNCPIQSNFICKVLRNSTQGTKVLFGWKRHILTAERWEMLPFNAAEEQTSFGADNTCLEKTWETKGEFRSIWVRLQKLCWKSNSDFNRAGLDQYCDWNDVQNWMSTILATFCGSTVVVLSRVL